MASREITISFPVRQSSQPRTDYLPAGYSALGSSRVGAHPQRENIRSTGPREIVISRQRVESCHSWDSSHPATKTHNIPPERRAPSDSLFIVRTTRTNADTFSDNGWLHDPKSNSGHDLSNSERDDQSKNPEPKRSTDGEDLLPRPDRMVSNTPVSTTNKAYAKKYKQFRRKLRRRLYWRFHSRPGTVLPKRISVKRDDILEDSYCALKANERLKDLKHRLIVNFLNEESTDIGGVQREWFMKLSKEMFNPDYGLFTYCSDENYLLEINPNSSRLCVNHLEVFRFIGYITGLAVYHGQIIDGFFIAPFYQMMLNKSVGLHDVEHADPTLYRSLTYLIKNDASDCDLTFSVTDRCLERTEEVDLVPNGRNITVTDANKHWFVREMIEWRFISRVREQMTKFMAGFHTFIKPRRIKSFHVDALSILLAGQPRVNVEDWQKYTQYAMGYGPRHPVIINFWKVVFEFSEERKSRLLEFVTGAPRVPINGFAELRGGTEVHQFMILKKGSVDSLPVAHICINALELPPYSDIATLRSKLVTAICNTEGFSGVDDPTFSNLVTRINMVNEETAAAEHVAEDS